MRLRERDSFNVGDIVKEKKGDRVGVIRRVSIGDNDDMVLVQWANLELSPPLKRNKIERVASIFDLAKTYQDQVRGKTTQWANIPGYADKWGLNHETVRIRCQLHGEKYGCMKYTAGDGQGEGWLIPLEMPPAKWIPSARKIDYPGELRKALGHDGPFSIPDAQKALGLADYQRARYYVTTSIEQGKVEKLKWGKYQFITNKNT